MGRIFDGRLWGALVVAAVAGSLTACERTPEPAPGEPVLTRVPVALHATGEEPTRTVLEEGRWLHWCSGDRIRIWIDAANDNLSLETTFSAWTDSAYGTFQGLITSPAEGAPVYALYPDAEGNVVDAVGVVATLPARQVQQGAGGFPGEACPMAAVPAPLAREQGAWVVRGMRFRLLASVLQLNVYDALGTGEQIRSVRLTADGALTGTFFTDTPAATGEPTGFEVRDAGPSAIDLEVDGALAVGASAEQGALLYMGLLPGSHVLRTVRVVTDAAIYDLTLTHSTGLEAVRGHIHRAGINLQRAVRTPLPPPSYLEESFDGFTGSSAPVSGTLFNTGTYGSAANASMFATTGWTLSTGYVGRSCIRLSSSSSKGVLTTPALASIDGTRDVEVSFNAYNWETNAATLTITASSGTVAGGAVALPAGVAGDHEIPAGMGLEACRYAVRVGGADASTHITFTGEKRYFLDSIVVRDAFWVDGGGTVPDPNPDPNPDPDPDPTVYAWAELPAQTTGSNFLYVTHRVPDQPAMRNYSLCYDPERHAALWVAYPMHACYKGSAGRNESWTYDPSIATAYQPYLKNSYTGGYSRGHQCASGDRQLSVEANRETFYFSNMTPQLQNFNGNLWASLERKVQDEWICSDTLYVVTGCWFDPADPRTTTDRNGMVCPVPNAYFKVLARSRTGVTGRSIQSLEASEVQCTGFWFDHFATYSTKDKVSAADMRSVAEIERLTGQTFFPTLSRLDKTQCTASDWKL